MKTFKLADEVIARIAQIIQEALLTGTDAIDKFRAIELCKQGKDELVLSENYKQVVKDDHQKLLDNLTKLQEQQKTVVEQPKVFQLDNNFGIMQIKDDETN